MCFAGQGSEKINGLENIVNFVDLTHLPGDSTWGKTKKGALSPVTTGVTQVPKAKKSNIDPGVRMCPVCDVVIVTTLSLAEHLESCDGMQGIFDFDVVEDIEDNNSEDVFEPTKTGQCCPICSSCIEGDLKSHVDYCLRNSGIMNILDELTDPNKNEYSEENPSSIIKEFKDCPICGLIILDNFETHLDHCLNKSIDEHDLDTSDCELPINSCDIQTEVSTAVLDDGFISESINIQSYTTSPVCSKRFEINIEARVSDCLNSSMTYSGFDEPMEFESESPKNTDHGLTQVSKVVDSSLSKYVTGSSKCNKNIKIFIGKDTEKGLVDLNETIDPNESKYSKENAQSIVMDSKDCPMCGLVILDNFENHLDNCLNKSIYEHDLDISDCELPEKSGDKQTEVSMAVSDGRFNCESIIISNTTSPVCSKIFEIDKVNQSKVSRSVCLKNSSVFIDVTNSRESCPVCTKFIRGDMHSHIDKCLNTFCSDVDFDEPIKMIKNSETPVKIVNNISKIPLLKTLDTNKNNLEVRVACRICGIKFAVSKFNGHVC